jgi:hypothetical protein
MHIHSARKYFGWMLGVSAVLTPLALAAPIGLSTGPAGLAPVTGQVQLNGQPISDVLICFDAEGDHSACASADVDGSFRIYTRGRGRGLAPGTYRVHLFSAPGGPSVPSKYQDAGTSGLVVDVDQDWNDFSFDLR